MCSAVASGRMFDPSRPMKGIVMFKEIAEKLDAELDAWRTRLEELRVKANLGKMELRDRERALLEEFQPAYDGAMKKLGELKDSAGDEAKAVRAGLEAGWKELRKSYEAARLEKDDTGPK